uniref:NADH dehydrogenase subunit 2 n=1 Tax=Gargara minuta TaxID=3021816 RepID=UPI00237BE97E|nr:NADH dehydrogenase subunit 2 [Gargara minuta]WBV77328.1 NADH dehydrogenase subunit 2 [Gargara minuta]
MLMNLEIMFNFCMVMGVTVAICSNNWLSVWVGLELSTMCFMPIMSNKSKLNSESCMKYFIIQSMSSSIMMMGVIMMSMNLNSSMLTMAILIKLGVVPFHTWVMSIIEGMSYYPILMLLTITKLAPINMMSTMNENLNLFIIMGLWVGSISGINQNSIKKIMVYSSIFNMSLMISTMNKMTIWLTFFIMYSMSITLFIYLTMKMNFSFINQMMINNLKLPIKLTCWISLMSMGGFPPFPMFFGKIMVIKILMEMKELLITSMMILSSLIVMFFYMRMATLSMLMYSSMPKWMKLNTTDFNSFIIMISMTLPMIMFNLKSL